MQFDGLQNMGSFGRDCEDEFDARRERRRQALDDWKTEVVFDLIQAIEN